MSSMPEIRVNQIDVWVHSFWNSQDQPRLQYVPAYQDLINLWRARLLYLADSPNSILLQFSPLSQAQIDNQDPSFNPKFDKQELKRIDTIKGLLGPRYFPLAGDYSQGRDQLIRRFQERSISFDPQNTTMNVWGESLGLCINSFGKIAQTAFAIPDHNYHILPELSMSEQRVELVTQQFSALPWWKKQYLGFKQGPLL